MCQQRACMQNVKISSEKGTKKTTMTAKKMKKEILKSKNKK